MRIDMGEKAGRVSPVVLSILVAVILVGFLAFLFFFRPRALPEAEQIGEPAGPARSRLATAGPAEDAAKTAACRENLAALRKTIAEKKLAASLPPTIQAFNDTPMTVKTCPLSRQYYAYNPDTGQIYCTTPEHRTF